MEKLPTFLIFFFLASAMAIPTARSIDKRPEAVQAWFKNLPNAKEKLTTLHFYFHDVVSGDNPTAMTVAEANITRTSPTGFGLIRMMDNPLTVGPEPDSRVIGRARGIYGSTSLEDFGYLMTFNFVFLEGEYNGSTLSMLAHNPISDRYREMPIGGGSGVFRLARGIATTQLVWANVTSQDAVIEYNIVVLHYE